MHTTRTRVVFVFDRFCVSFRLAKRQHFQRVISEKLLSPAIHTKLCRRSPLKCPDRVFVELNGSDCFSWAVYMCDYCLIPPFQLVNFDRLIHTSTRTQSGDREILPHQSNAHKRTVNTNEQQHSHIATSNQLILQLELLLFIHIYVDNRNELT